MLDNEFLFPTHYSALVEEWSSGRLLSIRRVTFDIEGYFESRLLFGTGDFYTQIRVDEPPRDRSWPKVHVVQAWHTAKTHDLKRETFEDLNVPSFLHEMHRAKRTDILPFSLVSLSNAGQMLKAYQFIAASPLEKFRHQIRTHPIKFKLVDRKSNPSEVTEDQWVGKSIEPLPGNATFYVSTAPIREISKVTIFVQSDNRAQSTHTTQIRIMGSKVSRPILTDEELADMAKGLRIASR